MQLYLMKFYKAFLNTSKTGDHNEYIFNTFTSIPCFSLWKWKRYLTGDHHVITSIYYCTLSYDNGLNDTTQQSIGDTIMNEYKHLSNVDIFKMYKQSVKAYRQSPRIMPYNDREYLLRRKIDLHKECIRRGLL